MRRLAAFIAAIALLAPTLALAQSNPFNPFGPASQTYAVPVANGGAISTTNPEPTAQPGRYLGDFTLTTTGTTDFGVDVSGYGSLVLIPSASTASAFSGVIQFAATAADTTYGRFNFQGASGRVEYNNLNPVTTTGTGGGNALLTDVYGAKLSMNATVTGGSVTYRVYGRAQGIRTPSEISVAATQSLSVALTPQAGTTANSTGQLCSQACNVYGFGGSSTVAGGIMLFNATACPADGTVTPIRWKPTTANQDYEIRFDTPLRMTTGAVLCFSTTGPFTKTASATAFLYGETKQ